MVFLKAHLTGRLKDPNFLLKCIIEDIESNISKADEEPKKEKVIDYNKTVSSFEREMKDEIARQDAWKNMKESGQKGIKISNRKETKGKRYKKVETEYPNRMYVEGGKGILGKKNLIRTSFIPLDSAKTVEFKTSSSKLIESIGKEGLLRDLKSLTQYKDFLDITALANVINTKQDIPIRINTGEKNKKAQILQYAKTTGKKRVKEIFNRVHSLLMDAKKKAHKGEHKKAISSLNKIILANYDAFNQVVSVKAKKVKNITQIKELETSDERVKDTTRLFFAELAATVKEAFTNLKDDSDEDNAASNQKQIATVLSNNLSGNTYKSNDPKLIYNILTNLDSAKEVPKQLFGDAIDTTSDIVSGRTPKGKQRLPRTEEQIAMIEQIKRERKGRENIFESLKQMFDHSDNKKSRRKIKELSESIREKNWELNGLLELFGKTPEEGLMERIKRASNRMEQEMKEAKKILNNDIKKAETNKIFDIIDIVKSSEGIKVIFREEPYRKGMKGYNAYMDSIKSILASLNESVGNEKALDIFTKYGKLITGSKTQQSPDKRQKASSFLSRKKKEVATKKKLLSKKERKMLQLPTDLREDIRDISEELLTEMVNFNAFLLVTDKENENSPAYWYNKIRQLVGQSEGKLERIKTPQKEKNLVGKYYKKLNLTFDYKKVQSISDKINDLSDDEYELKEKIKEYSDELANFEGGMKGLVELSKSFEEMKKPYIDLFIEVSDLKNKLSETPETEKMTEKEIKQAAKKALDSFKGGNESAAVLGYSVKTEYEYIKDKTSGVYEPLIYESRKEYEKKQKDLIEERKFTYVSRNKNKKYDEITDEDLKEVTVKELLEAKLISEKDIAPYPDTDKGKRPKTLREKDYYLGDKNIKFYNAVLGRLIGTIRTGQNRRKGAKLTSEEKEKIKEQYLKKREELLKLEKEITNIIIKSPYFDKRAKASRITGEVILNRDPKDVWYKSIISDTRKKEYFIGKETFMGIALEGQIKNEAVSIFEIMGGSYNMNLDAITDYKQLKLQLKKLSKKIESTIKVREKLNDKILDEIESGEEE